MFPSSYQLHYPCSPTNPKHLHDVRVSKFVCTICFQLLFLNHLLYFLNYWLLPIWHWTYHSERYGVILKIISPERIVVILAIIFGLVWIIITPPFQAPDEDWHFFRVFQISEGDITAFKIGDQKGAYLPRSIIETVENINPGLKFNSDERQDLELVRKYLSISLNVQEKIFHPSPNSYSPIGYLPQLCGIFIGKFLSLSPLIIMYLGRFFNLVCWIFLMYWAIRITPTNRWLFLVIAMMPMNLFLASSLSIDALLNSLTLLYIACVFHLSSKNSEIKRKWLATLWIISVAIPLIKPVYYFIIPIFLIIPKHLMDSQKRYYGYFCFIMISSLFSTSLWHVLNRDLMVTFLPYTSPTEQFLHVLKNRILTCHSMSFNWR